ncbi:hypothetical protein ABVT39_027705, partial [Epinephelus coioides]
PCLYLLGAQTSSPNSSGTPLGRPSTMYRKPSSLLGALSFSCCTTIINMQEFALAKYWIASSIRKRLSQASIMMCNIRTVGKDNGTHDYVV